MKTSLSNQLYWSTSMRVILGISWLYAGVLEKLMNPGFLNPGSPEYVGITLQYLAQGSVIRGFLDYVVVPQPYLTGVLVMIGEISFGVLTLSGAFTRLASAVALITNGIYFLAAEWSSFEEFALNLIWMALDIYFLVYGPGQFSIDSLVKWKTDVGIKWAVVLSVGIYISVIMLLILANL